MLSDGVANCRADPSVGDFECNRLWVLKKSPFYFTRQVYIERRQNREKAYPNSLGEGIFWSHVLILG